MLSTKISFSFNEIASLSSAVRTCLFPEKVILLTEGRSTTVNTISTVFFLGSPGRASGEISSKRSRESSLSRSSLKTSSENFFPMKLPVTPSISFVSRAEKRIS